MADYAADPEKGHQTTFATGEKGVAANGQVVLRGLDQDAPEGAVHRNLKSRHLQVRLVAISACSSRGSTSAHLD
ncbi:hypothetical protein JCM3775_002984 [Rhodotorula graminis]